MTKTKEQLFETIRGTIIVSCQALPNEPLYNERESIMPYMAMAAKEAGGTMIRTSSVRDVVEIKKKTGLPVIGLIKRGYADSEVYITPTMREINELVEAGSDIVALDCTFSKRLTPLDEFIGEIKAKYPEIILMADISTYEEGINAYNLGVDIVGTTMNGYTEQSREANIGNKELITKLKKVVDIPIIAEGKVHTPQNAKEMLETGAFAVVVGGAITRPLEIATRFFDAIK